MTGRRVLVAAMAFLVGLGVTRGLAVLTRSSEHEPVPPIEVTRIEPREEPPSKRKSRDRKRPKGAAPAPPPAPLPASGAGDDDGGDDDGGDDSDDGGSDDD